MPPIPMQRMPKTRKSVNIVEARAGTLSASAEDLLVDLNDKLTLISTDSGATQASLSPEP